MIGYEKLKSLTDAAWAALEEESPDDAVIGVAMLVIESKADDTTVISTFCTDRRQWVQRALVAEAQETVESIAVGEDE